MANQGLNVQPQGTHASLQNLQQLRHVSLAYPYTARLSRASNMGGQHRSRAINRGMEFEEVRLYQPGDDVRNIDWRVTARTQQTHTKCYRDEKEKPVITLVDQRRSLFFGSRYCFKSVYACYLAALINWATVKRGDRSGGLVIGSENIREVRPARSHQAVNRWLQLLCHFNHAIDIHSTHQQPSLTEGLQQCQRMAKTGTDCILILDCYDMDEHSEKALYQLAQHNSVTLYWLVDPFEKQLPDINTLTISDGQKKTPLSLGNNQQQEHHQRFLQKQLYIRKLCQRFLIELVEVDITQTLSDVLPVIGHKAAKHG